MRVNEIHAGEEYTNAEGEVRTHADRTSFAVIDESGRVRAIRHSQWEASVVASGLRKYESEQRLRGAA